MRLKFILTQFLLIAFFALPSKPFYAQNSAVVQMNGSKLRTPLDVPRGESTITLKGLLPGNTYEVIASLAAQGQLGSLELAPAQSTGKSNQPGSDFTAQKNILRFTAPDEQVEFRIKASAEQQTTSVPMFLSIQCETCVDKQPLKKSWLAESMANLQVVDGISAQSLITNTLIGGDCFTITNVTSSGNSLARGTFSNGSNNIGIATGMVMSTGRIDILPGPNADEGANGGFGTPGFDANLSSLVTGNLRDVNVIEFDFTPTANTVQFDFVFGSEEYCEYVGTNFNDVFGFFISGPGIPGVRNLAVIPGTGGVPVTVNNVNHNSNTQYYTNNSPNLFDCDFIPPTHLLECQLDGWTKLLTATATVIPCSTYHIKLAIADVQDQFWDSAVFLRANSFNAGGTVAASPAYQNGLGSAVEGCSSGAIRFVRGNGDVSQPLTVNFAVSGTSTATAGVDYTALISPVIIPVGQSEILVPVNVLNDGISEGLEKIVLLIDNSCQCQQAQVEFLINDQLPLLVHVVQDTTICEGFSVTLVAQSEGGLEPLSYVWSTGDTTQFVTVSPTVSTTYSLTVTDACGGTATDDALVDVIPFFRETVEVLLCPGGAVEIEGIVYTTAGTVIDTSYETFFCGKITTYLISLLDPAQGSQTISFCAGGSVEINGQVYHEPGTVLDTLSTSTGCDSIVTYTLVVLPAPIVAETITFCPGDAVEIAGNIYNAPGTVTDTLTTTSGCDSIVTYTLVLAPQPMRSETISFCPGESIVVGGVTITAPGNLLVFIPAAIGCDTMVNYTFVWLTQPTLEQTIGFCQGETVQLGGNSYTQPGTVVLTLPASAGCDTIATYTLQYLTPAPSNVSITCPSIVSVNVPSGASGAVVNYGTATANSDCPCPGIDITRSSGLASGSTFPLGISQVCYQAQDVCGQTKTCCFNVSVSEENPCDTKVIGCMKYELLTITQDQFKNKTYRVRVTNNCPSELIYTAIQTPSGLVAMAPANNAVYDAPSGNQYLVRNPNYSPFYSVRYRSLGAGIANGASDILRYTLPAQAEVLFINITSRLSIQQFYEAHLNTFYCPVGVTPLDQRSNDDLQLTNDGAIIVFPNPTDGAINVDMPSWEGAQVRMQVFNSQGQRVFFNTVTAALEPQRIDLPQGIADGLYFLEISTESGDKEVVKFVIKH